MAGLHVEIPNLRSGWYTLPVGGGMALAPGGGAARSGHKTQ